MKSKIFIFSITLFSVILMGASCVKVGSKDAGPMGVYRSSDKGDSWEAVTAFPTPQGVKSIAGLKVYRIFEDPSDPNAFYLGTRGQGLFYTYDNGDSWQEVKFFSGKFIYALAVDPKDKCTIYASDGATIYKTTDCSRTWNLVFTETRANERFVSIAIDNKNARAIYGLQLNGDLLVSRDEGKTWQTIKRFGFQAQQMEVDHKVADRIFVASYRKGLYRSDDGGKNWVTLNEELKKIGNETFNFYRLVLNTAQKDSLYWISKYGILRSDDAGQTWTELKLLTPPGSITILAFDVNEKNPKEIYYTGSQLGEKNVHIKSTFYKSSDGGIKWETKKLPTNTLPVMVKVNAKNDNNLLMGFTVLN